MLPRHHRGLNLVLAALAVAVFAVLALVVLTDREPEPTARCGRPHVTTPGGEPLHEDYVALISGVHAAACARDYDAVVRFMNLPPDFLPSAADRVREWRTADPAGVKLAALAAVLEQPGVGGQGGLTFCVPEKGRVAFSRGTITIPPALGGIEFARAGRPVEC